MSHVADLLLAASIVTVALTVCLVVLHLV